MDYDENIEYLKYLWDDAEFLQNKATFEDTGSKDNNWGMTQCIGQTSVAAYFPEFNDIDRWMTQLSGRMDYMVNRLVQADGSYLEASDNYPPGVFENFIYYKNLVDMIGALHPGKSYAIPANFYPKLKQFAYYFMNLMEPCGYLTEYGDDAYDASEDLLDNMKYVSSYYGDDALKYVATNGTEGRRPANTSVYYPLGKIGVQRTGWDRNDLFLFTNARAYATHSHNDDLHISAYAYGRRLLVDTSDRSYSDDDISNWQRKGRTSHNAIEIDDTTTYPDLASISADGGMISNNSFDLFDGYHSEIVNNNTVTQKRKILLIKPAKFWIVSDYVKVPSGQHKFNQTWHMFTDAGIALEPNTDKAVSNYETGANIQVVPADPDQLEASLQNGYNGSAADRYASYVKRQSGDATYDTILYPVPEGVQTKATVERINTGVPSTVATALKINLNNDNGQENGYYYNSYESVPVERNFADYKTNGTTAYIQQNRQGEVQSAALYGGSNLSRNGQDLINSSKKMNDLGIVWGSGTIDISSSLDNIADLGNLQLYSSQEINSVTFNGKEVAFVQSGTAIAVGKSSLALETVEASVYNSVYEIRQSDLAEFKVAIPLQMSNRKISAQITGEGQNKICGPDAWDGAFGAFSAQDEIAQSKNVSVSTESTTNTADLAVDGDISTEWLARDGNFPQSLTIDLGDIYQLSGMDIFWHKGTTGLGVYHYKITTSEDGINYTTGNEKVSDHSALSSEALPVKSRYVKISILSHDYYEKAGIREVRIYGRKMPSTVVSAPWSTSFTLGNPDSPVIAMEPLRIYLPGVKGKSVGFVSNGQLIPITKSLAADDSASADAALNNGEAGVFSINNDLVIWTKAVGEYVLYGSADAESPTEGQGNNTGGGPTTPTPTPVPTPTPTPVPTPTPTPAPHDGSQSNPGGGHGGSSGGGGPINIPNPTPVPEQPVAAFKDISGHWAQDEIRSMVEKNIVKGKDNEHFAPDANITRAEVTALIVRAFNIPADQYPGRFNDVEAGDWYDGVIQTAAANGLISGDDGYFRPNDEITREELGKMIVLAYRFAGKEVEGEQENIQTFTDEVNISSWARQYINPLLKLGLMKGGPDGAFRPRDSASRAETVVVIYRLLELIANE